MNDAASHLREGQLVELIRQPPNYGRSLDGTLGRIEQIGKLYKEAVFVEVYRRHRKTGKPLKLRHWSIPVGQLKIVTEITHEQTEFLAQVEVLRRDERARRHAMKADRIAWEQRILAMQDGAPPPQDDPMALAEMGMGELERRLVQYPPVGNSSGDVADFFDRHRSALVTALADLISKNSEREKAA